jgi:hypothetical protein
MEEKLMLRSFCGSLVICIGFLLGASAAALAAPEQFQMGHDIHIAADQKTGDVSCLNCSIYIHGEVAGDAFALNGDVVLETGAQLAGDITTLHGDARLADGSKVSGDVTSIGGTVRKQPLAAISGDVSSMSGSGWVLLVFLVPVAILGAIIALVVWLVQRSRQNAAIPVRT